MALIRDDLRRGTLVSPFGQTLTAHGAYYMCWRPSRGEHEALDWFSEFLRTEALAQEREG
ncbi:hypothetical protein D3C84_1252570 [compost metagenome]